MSSTEPPSFSLGFVDLDPASVITFSDSDLELLEPGFSSPPVLKRAKEIDNEVIEVFSSPEDFPASDATTSTRSRVSSCISSRVSLQGSGVLTNNQSSFISRVRGKRKRLDVPSTGSLFQRSSNSSPLRKFQLLDSDSDSDSETNGSSSKDQQSVVSKSIQCSGNHDYFTSIKTSNAAQKQSSSNSGFYQQTRQSLDFSPPSHRFFMHSDPRIQNLARERLPNFLPLGIFNDREVVFIDYMNQFSSKERPELDLTSQERTRR